MNELFWPLVKVVFIYFAIAIVFTIIGVIFNRLKTIVKDKINKKIASVKTNGEVCPKCGGKLIMRFGKYGRFIGCSNFPECRYTRK